MKFIETMICLATVLTSSLITLGQDTRRPNVVFIMADDLGWGELGCYGQEKIPTPHIDSLARQGTRFTSHYSGAPVCAPSRCVLMTGLHTGHCLIRGNQQAKKTLPQFTEGQHPIADVTRTMAEAFHDAGYATGAMGKWGLGPVGSTGDPNRQGFDLFVGYNCQAVAHSYFARYLWKNDQPIEINPSPIPGHKKQPDGEVRMETFQGQTYAPSVMVAEAERFLDDHAQGPFFLYLPFIEPHVAMHPPQASVERFPESWDDEVYRGESGYLPHPRPRAAYAAMISDLDGYVGRVLTKLKELGIEDNTIVVFTSDNGTTHEGNGGSRFHVGGCDAEFFNSTAGLKGYKGSVYEGGIRVPMIVRFPEQVAAGATDNTVSYFADWFPTLAAATGLEAPIDSDGENLWPNICGKGQLREDRKPLVWVFPEYGGQVCVRMGDFKVLRRNLSRPQQPEAWEVYDIAHDRNESNDLAIERPELIEKAITILTANVEENEVFPLEIPGVNDAKK